MTAPLNLCHWINGKRVEADRPSVRTNPSDTNEVVAHLPIADKSGETAATIPWPSLSLSQFEGILQDDANLYLHSGPYR